MCAAPQGLVSPAARVAVLCTVPVAWGTYAPAVKAVYGLPTPPPGVVFSAAYYVVALGCLLSLSAVGRGSGEEGTSELDEGSVLIIGGRREGSVLWAGVELGGYLFVGNLFQVYGLQTISADAAAFLVQLTTIIVPVLESVTTGGRVAQSTVIASGVAFLGVAVLCAEGLDANASLITGDLCVVAAAFLYSLHVVRLSALAPNIPPVRLATAKASVEAVLAIGSVGALYSLTPFVDGRAFFEALTLPSADSETLRALGFATLWCGAITCAYTIWAQSFGQRDVPPSRANLIYTSQPIFSAVFAFGLLGEMPTPATLGGGALILGAVVSEVFRETHGETES